jgi:hypothetical protein
MSTYAINISQDYVNRFSDVLPVSKKIFIAEKHVHATAGEVSVILKAFDTIKEGFYFLFGTSLNGHIGTSFDGGLSFYEQFAGVSSQYVQGLFCTASKKVLVGVIYVATERYIYISNDYGLSFSSINIASTSKGVRCFCQLPSGRILAGCAVLSGSNFIDYSDDDASSFNNLYTTDKSFNILGFIQSQSGNVIALSSRSSGSCRCFLASPPSYSFSEISADVTVTQYGCGVWVDDNTVVLGTGKAAASCYIVRSINAGSTWSTVYTYTGGNIITCMLKISNGFIFAGTRKTTDPGASIFYSEDSGATWHINNTVTGATQVNTITQMPNSYLFAFFSVTSAAGYLRRSFNNGSSWTTINTTFSILFCYNILYAGNASILMFCTLTSNKATVLRSDNDGTNWYQVAQFSGETNCFAAISIQ